MKLSYLVVVLSVVLGSSALAADLEKGKVAFGMRCASCHGATGLADGPVAKAMAAGTVTNLASGPFKFAIDVTKVKELIQKGGGSLGLNAMMPPAPSIPADELEDLAAFVVSLRK